ncbi:hypothetical protein E1287_06240 [Actinomadura sp. KC06]|uniref:hypothetical protein n=1 Tax=Actinomadura sp. KC06 TaxID=2530369 RepID=UPI001042D0DE|nr:hypothetical protein [Actinomadura sp. KC06]TDD38146.1 hypothetical protein E1287_06240 [Actinomadura sp. KC06]
MATYLTLRSLTILSDNEVAMVFIDSAGEEMTYRFTSTDTDQIKVINGEDSFSSQYRQVPGPATPMWPERLASQALQAYQDPLPAGETLERLRTECHEELHRRWHSGGRRP